MKVTITPGRYVIAVSGGVDSMALLHVLKACQGVELIVAHFDHGIRPDSSEDRTFVESIARQYDLTFESAEGKLGATASEAVARAARYKFLREVQAKHKARAIITAHHQDDLLETAIINLSRGTGRRGLTSLNSSDELVRPLLNYSKSQILEYAQSQNLQWREDSTNADQQYLRNYIRHTILPKFSAQDREKFLTHISAIRTTGEDLDNGLTESLEMLVDGDKLDRSALKDLPKPIIKELLITWWRRNDFYNYEAKTLNRALDNVLQGKTGSIVPLKGDLQMIVGRHELALSKRER